MTGKIKHFQDSVYMLYIACNSYKADFDLKLKILVNTLSEMLRKKN